MRLYETQCLGCTQFAVLHGVCRACGQLDPKPDHPLHPNENDDAPPDHTNLAPDNTHPLDHDERGDASDDFLDFDLGEGD